MKKLIFTIAIYLTTTLSFSQVGTVAPDFTATDINGNIHNLYDYLNDGKVVIIDVSTTWCTPCWWLHHDWHYLEDWYAEFGPNGTDQLAIFLYEADEDTGLDDLNGTGPNTQGDWVTGTPYPIFNESPTIPVLNSFINGGFPSVDIICPSDRIIKYNLWDNWAHPEIMRAQIIELIDQCGSAAGINENNLLDASVAPNPTTGTTTIRFAATTTETASVNLYSVSGQLISSTTHQVVSGSNAIELDMSSLEAGTYFVKINSIEAVSKMIPVIKK